MNSDLVMINKLKYIQKKNFNKIIKFKDIIHIIKFLFGIILIIFFIFNNIDNQKLLKQILKYKNKYINDTNLFNKVIKVKILKIELIY